MNEDGGATRVSLGFIQLVLEMLEQSCDDQDTDFNIEFDGDMDELTASNLKQFIGELISNRVC